MNKPTDIDKFKALFMLAGINVKSVYELPSQYWPEAYEDMRKAHPWALMWTDVGPITIGWRKRVISIGWKDTPVRVLITEDNVTKDEALVHAWSYPKALEYLCALSGTIRVATEEHPA